jgi:tetrahydromethanopterin S-methyltransferase subunit G
MGLLHELYSQFDAAVERFDLWKLDTIGDAYVVIGGLLREVDAPLLTERLFKIAQRMVEVVQAVGQSTGHDIGIRIGIHSGRVAMGILGTLRPRFHVFGPTVLEAEHMESEGRKNCIQVSEAAFRLYLQRTFDLRLRDVPPPPVVALGTSTDGHGGGGGAAAGGGAGGAGGAGVAPMAAPMAAPFGLGAVPSSDAAALLARQPLQAGLGVMRALWLEPRPSAGVVGESGPLDATEQLAV